MAEPKDDPKEMLAEGMAKHRELSKARDESLERAAAIRRIRRANGFDRLIAALLGGAR